MAQNAFEPDPSAYAEGFLRQDYEKVVAALRDDPSQARRSFGPLQTTLLHAAAYDGKAEIAELLISLGSDVNAQEVNGRTPLHDAANNGHLDVIEVLLRNGADLEAKDKEGMTPLAWGRISRSGRSQQVVDLLQRHGARG
jgi:ankyrin repeat protein